uniref:Uncharacterized protein n=2 Tax=Oryza TaxID=4527 RepID=A0A0E0DYE1_9ORYZ
MMTMANLAIEHANMVLSPISLSGWILSNFQCQLKQEDKWAKFMSNFLRVQVGIPRTEEQSVVVHA